MFNNARIETSKFEKLKHELLKKRSENRALEIDKELKTNLDLSALVASFCELCDLLHELAMSEEQKHETE